MSACIPIRHFRFICLCTHHIFPYLKSFFLSYSLSPSVSLFHSLSLSVSLSLCLLIGIVNVGNFKHLRSMWSTYIFTFTCIWSNSFIMHYQFRAHLKHCCVVRISFISLSRITYNICMAELHFVSTRIAVLFPLKIVWQFPHFIYVVYVKHLS